MICVVLSNYPCHALLTPKVGMTRKFYRELNLKPFSEKCSKNRGKA